MNRSAEDFTVAQLEAMAWELARFARELDEDDEYCSYPTEFQEALGHVSSLMRIRAEHLGRLAEQ